MCEFVSWVEKRNKVYFLTGEQVFSETGQEKLKKLYVSPDDYCGHGTIRAWYGRDAGDGVDKEQTDFSTPDNFPSVIVKALKDGKFKGFPFPQGLLRTTLYADYQAKRAPLDADYQAKIATLYADYQAKIATLYADYQAKIAPLDADYRAKRTPLDADYQAKIAPLDADYEAKRTPLYADYQAKIATLYAAVWDLFAVAENRCKKWR